MINSFIAFKFLESMYFEKKKINGNAEAQTKHVLIRNSKVEIDDNSFNENIILLLHNGLIEIAKIPSSKLGETEILIESYFIKDYGIWTLDDFYNSENYKDFKRDDDAMTKDATDDGAIFGNSGLNPQEAFRLENIYASLVKEYFDGLKLNVNNKEINFLYEGCLSPQQLLTPEMATLLNKECYYIYWSNPFNDYNENLILVKDFLSKLSSKISVQISNN